MEFSPDTKYVTLPMLATIFSVTRMTAYNWFRRGRFKAIQVVPGGQWFVSTEEVERLKNGG